VCERTACTVRCGGGRKLALSRPSRASAGASRRPSSRGTVEPVRQDGCYAEKQEPHPALVLIVPCDCEQRGRGALRSNSGAAVHARAPNPYGLETVVGLSVHRGFESLPSASEPAIPPGERLAVFLTSAGPGVDAGQSRSADRASWSGSFPRLPGGLVGLAAAGSCLPSYPARQRSRRPVSRANRQGRAQRAAKRCPLTRLFGGATALDVSISTPQSYVPCIELQRTLRAYDTLVTCHWRRIVRCGCS
jgi:hypothetical protein